MTGFSDSAMEVSSAGDGVRTEAIAAGDHQPGRKPAERPAFSPARAGPATMLVKLPLFCLVACVRMRYFACAHQPTLTGSVMWWSRLSPIHWHLRVREEWGQNHGEQPSRCHG